MLNAVKDKICMVTGGGGSIGSEIVRALSRLNAKKIIAVDISENGLFDLLSGINGITAEIASIRDKDKMEQLFSVYRPDIIFHAAAHKHVPFMELCPEEAVKNNIRGTQIIMDLAEKYGAEKFVLISTDKAVEPINIMGASKRICEMMMYERSKTSKTVFSTVRFGNVIGSNGSVVPLFKKQIEKGIVTVTDKDATRYFMTIPQAARLAVSSLEIMKGGEVFVFDMGKPIKILGIAEKLIKDSGKEIIIEFTGLRKGDKLHEKLFYDFEKPQESGIDKILRAQGSSIKGLNVHIKKLCKLAAKCDRDGIYNLMMKITGKDLV